VSPDGIGDGAFSGWPGGKHKRAESAGETRQGNGE
jgi:hypothetical protein